MDGCTYAVGGAGAGGFNIGLMQIKGGGTNSNRRVCVFATCLSGHGGS